MALGLDPEALLHERFDTAEISLGGRRIDLARTRSEKYPRPGALPDVEPAGIETDLGRRDFTINAMAVPLADPDTLLDPFNGVADLERRVLRALHPKSFRDDPTRAIRAARYAARLGFDLDHRTANLLPAVELGNLSPRRLGTEIDLASNEATGLEALRLASAWGLLKLGEADLDLAAKAFDLLDSELWTGFCSRAEVTGVLLTDQQTGRRDALIEFPGSPSLACTAAERSNRPELLLARAAGAEWLDRWLSEWRGVNPAISGDDLLEAGIPRGEAIGAGLDAARTAALDQDIGDRDEQLRIAVAAATAFSTAEKGG
jgi:tRNA nucleotidyltransferase (CCA-adding enzyme)